MEKTEKEITAYVTRYALTQGVLKMRGRVSEGMLVVQSRDHGPDDYYHGNDWHETEDEACADYRKRVKRKIESVRRQLRKLEALDEAEVTIL